MHLGLRVPTTWYRARLKVGALDLNGLTLPGAPVLVAGSNGHIAWGFSNSYGDWLDLVTRACDWHGPGREVQRTGRAGPMRVRAVAGRDSRGDQSAPAGF